MVLLGAGKTWIFTDARGHRWRAAPSNVKPKGRKRGSWCLECYNLRREFQSKYHRKDEDSGAQSKRDLPFESVHKLEG